MEGRAILAAPDPITRGLTFWTSTQAPHWNRNEIAKRLGSAQTQVRCIAPEVGGGFGCKFGAYPEDFVVCGVAHTLKPAGQMDRDRAASISSPPIMAAISGPSSRLGADERRQIDRHCKRAGRARFAAPIRRRSISPGAPG